MEIYTLYTGYGEEYKPEFFVSTKEEAERLAYVYEYINHYKPKIVKLEIPTKESISMMNLPKQLCIEGYLPLDKNSKIKEYGLIFYLSIEDTNWLDSKFQGIKVDEIIFKELNDYEKSIELKSYSYSRSYVNFYGLVSTKDGESIENSKTRIKKMIIDQFLVYNANFR